MKPCTGYPAEEWIELYLTGSLSEEQAQAFEEHYSDCPLCLERVQAAQAVAHALSKEPIPAPAGRPIGWFAGWKILATAAALLLAAGVGYRVVTSHVESTHRSASEPAAPNRPAPAPPAANIEELADLVLPPFRGSSLRGDVDAHFDAGMKAYAAGHCSTAASLLSHVPADSSDSVAAQFYEGVCRMQVKDWNSASALLLLVASHGDSPQQEAAWYYAAQVALAQNHRKSAQFDLQSAIALHGDFEQRARHQLAILQGTEEK